MNSSHFILEGMAGIYWLPEKKLRVSGRSITIGKRTASIGLVGLRCRMSSQKTLKYREKHDST